MYVFVCLNCEYLSVRTFVRRGGLYVIVLRIFVEDSVLQCAGEQRVLLRQRGFLREDKALAWRNKECGTCFEETSRV